MSESVVLDKDGKEFKHATKIRLFTVQLTLKEMQSLANAITGFVNTLTASKKMLEPDSIMTLVHTLQKFKDASSSNDYEVKEIA